MPDRLIFTALPTRLELVDPGNYNVHLSVFISPRLEPNGQLDTVANRFGGYDNFTQFINNVIWDIEFDGITTYPGVTVESAAALGYREVGRVDSRLPGPKGNVEVFLLLEAGSETPAGASDGPRRDRR